MAKLDRELDDLWDRAGDLDIRAEVVELLASYVHAAEVAQEAHDANNDDDDPPHLAYVTAVPGALWRLGKLHRVEYDRDEGGRPTRRYHDFEDAKPDLCVDEETGQLFIVGGDYDVTARGIEG